PAQAAKALAEIVQKAAEPDQTSQEHHVRLGSDVDLTGDESPGDGEPGLVFKGGEGSTLIIEPKDPGRRPTIRFEFPKLPSRQSPWALTVSSGKVILRGLRFLIDAHETQTPNIIMASLCAQG